MGGTTVMEDSTLSRTSRPFCRTLSARLVSPLILGLGLAVAQAHASRLPPPTLDDDSVQAGAQDRTGGNFGYHIHPIAPSGVGIHVNMHVIRTTTFGWERFAEMVQVARAGGFYLLLNNLDGVREHQHIAATFENWSYDEKVTFATILAGSHVPVLLYVGAVEVDGVMFVVGAGRLVSWRNDVAWLKSITGANAGLVIDAGSLGEPDTAPGGGTFLGYYSLYARAMAALNIEVGFEAIRTDNQDRPLEDRRYYGLLQFITTRYATLPPGTDFDARIMSAIDAIPPAKTSLCNTIWLENTTWAELGDGDAVPQEWLNSWGVSVDQLQHAAAARLYEKGYGLIMPPEVFGVD